jgi:hypothetical protein
MIWEWAHALSYWVAAILGTWSLLIYIVTKDRRFSTFTVVVVLLYIMIQAVGASL